MEKKDIFNLIFLKLKKKMFNSFSVLNEAYIDFKEGLHLIKYKALFKEYSSENFIFLYQGSNICQFNSRFFQNKDAKESSKLLWIAKEYLKKLLNENDQHQTERILYRKIASNTNERTMISTLSPKNCYCVNSIYINCEKVPISIFKKLFIISIFNSLAFDFIIRRFVDSNATKSCLY
nr:class I SAM-dependent DNA methyltransferase [Borreliella valaisiana]